MFYFIFSTIILIFIRAHSKHTDSPLHFRLVQGRSSFPQLEYSLLQVFLFSYKGEFGDQTLYR